MKWQHLLYLFFGILMIVFGWVQTKEKNTPILVFVLWTICMVIAIVWLFYDFSKKRKDKKAKDDKSEK